MATNMYLVITDGTTTVTIADGSGGAVNYKLRYGTWAPTIAGLRRSKLGGRGPYEDAVEDMLLDIYGATAAAAYANLQTLITLLDQAERWSSGENVSAVLLKYSPGGGTVSSAANPLQAAILGRAEGDATVGAVLQPEFNEAQHTFAILGVQVKFVRRGEWLHITDTAASSATTNADIATISMAGAVGTPSPTKISVSQIIMDPDYSTGIVLIVDSSDDLLMINAEGMTATKYTSVADTARHARNSNVLRYTPTDVAAYFSGTASLTSFDQNSRLVAIYAVARNNSATTKFTLKARVLNGSGGGYKYAEGPNVVIAANAIYPAPYFLGVLALSGPAYLLKLSEIADAASGTLDIDSIVIVKLDNPNNAVIELPNNVAALNVGINIDHQFLTKPQPRVEGNGSGWEYYGDPVICTSGATLYGLLLKCGGAGARDNWRYFDGTLWDNVWTAVRTTGYLVPQ